MAYALALSGGGLLGAAHLGVLTVLHERGLMPTAVAGTSAGGLIASLLALQVHPRDLTERGRQVAADPARYFGLNAIALLEDLLPGHPAATGLVTPAGFLGALLSLAPDARRTEDWRLPCCLTAVDLVHLQAVAFLNREVTPARGRWVTVPSAPLDLAMQATMALPGLFAAPVAEGRVLVDGGTADTLPVDWAYALQPGPVLAVDVAAPYQLPADRLGISEIVSRAEQYSTHTLATLRAETVPAFHVRPDTRDVPFFGFRDYDHLVDVGRRAMENALAAFEAYLDAAV